MPDASPSSKRSRTGPDPQPPPASKRARTSPTAAEEYERLKDATFPVGITALPHVMKQIDRLLMTPEEALVDAAATADMEWLSSLLRKSNCAAGRALVAAASRGHALVLVKLMRAISDGDRDGGEDPLTMMLEAATAAAGADTSRWCWRCCDLSSVEAAETVKNAQGLRDL